MVNCQDAIGATTPDGQVLDDRRQVLLYLLEHAGVASIHGGAYGVSPYFRISFATSEEILEQACRRIWKAFAELC